MHEMREAAKRDGKSPQSVIEQESDAYAPRAVALLKERCRLGTVEQENGLSENECRIIMSIQLKLGEKNTG